MVRVKYADGAEVAVGDRVQWPRSVWGDAAGSGEVVAITPVLDDGEVDRVPITVRDDSGQEREITTWWAPDHWLLAIDRVQV